MRTPRGLQGRWRLRMWGRGCAFKGCSLLTCVRAMLTISLALPQSFFRFAISMLSTMNARCFFIAICIFWCCRRDSSLAASIACTNGARTKTDNQVNYGRPRGKLCWPGFSGAQRQQRTPMWVVDAGTRAGVVDGGATIRVQ